MKRELLKKAKLSAFKTVFVPIFFYGRESCVMTERIRSQVQAFEMRFLQRIEGVMLFNKVRSSEILKSLNIEPLLLRIERSQLTLLAKVKGKRPVGRPQIRWENSLRILDEIGRGFSHEKCWKWWRTVMCGDSILSCCTCNPHGHERALKEEEEEKNL